MSAFFDALPLLHCKSPAKNTTDADPCGQPASTAGANLTFHNTCSVQAAFAEITNHELFRMIE